MGDDNWTLLQAQEAQISALSQRVATLEQTVAEMRQWMHEHLSIGAPTRFEP